MNYFSNILAGSTLGINSSGVLQKEALDDLLSGQLFTIETDFFIRNIQRIRIDSFITQSYFIDIGIPKDYERAQTELAGL